MKHTQIKRLVALILCALFCLPTAVFAAPDQAATARYVCVSAFDENGGPAAFAFSDTRNENTVALYVAGGSYTLTEDVSDLMLLLNDAVLSVGSGGAFSAFLMSGGSAIAYDGYSEKCVLDAPTCEAETANEVAAFYMDDANLAPYVLFITGDATLDDRHNHGTYAYINVGKGARFTIDTILDAENADVFGDVFIKAPKEGDPHGLNLQDHLLVGESGSITADEGQILELREGCSSEGASLYLFPNYENVFFEDPENLDLRTFQYVLDYGFEGFVLQPQQNSPEYRLNYDHYNVAPRVAVGGQVFYPGDNEAMTIPSDAESLTLSVGFIHSDAEARFRGIVIDYWDGRGPIFVRAEEMSDYSYTLNDLTTDFRIEIVTYQRVFPGEFNVNYWDFGGEAYVEYNRERLDSNTVYPLPDADEFMLWFYPPARYNEDGVLLMLNNDWDADPISCDRIYDSDTGSFLYYHTFTAEELDADGTLTVEVFWSQAHYDFNVWWCAEDEFFFTYRSHGNGAADYYGECRDSMEFADEIKIIAGKDLDDMVFFINCFDGAELEEVRFGDTIVYPASDAFYDAENMRLHLPNLYEKYGDDWFDLEFNFSGWHGPQTEGTGYSFSYYPDDLSVTVDAGQGGFSPVAYHDYPFPQDSDSVTITVSPMPGADPIRGLILCYDDGGIEAIPASEMTDNSCTITDFSRRVEIRIVPGYEVFCGEYKVNYGSYYGSVVRVADGEEIMQNTPYPLPEGEFVLELTPPEDEEHLQPMVCVNYGDPVEAQESDGKYYFRYTPDTEERTGGMNFAVWWSQDDYNFHNYYLSEDECVVEIYENQASVDIEAPEKIYYRGDLRAILDRGALPLVFTVTCPEGGRFDGFFYNYHGMINADDPRVDYDAESGRLVFDPGPDEPLESWNSFSFQFRIPEPLGATVFYEPDEMQVSIKNGEGALHAYPGELIGYVEEEDSLDLCFTIEEGVTFRGLDIRSYAPTDTFDESVITMLRASEMERDGDQYLFRITDFEKCYEIVAITDRNGFMLFDGEYYADYDPAHGAALYLDGELVPNWNYADFTVGEAMNFTFTCPEGVEMPYLVLVEKFYPQGAIGYENLTDFVLSGGFSYTPKEATGFFLHVYWTEDAFRYHTLSNGYGYCRDLRISSPHAAVSVEGDGVLDSAGYYEWTRVLVDIEAETLEIGLNIEGGYTLERVNIDGTVLDLSGGQNYDPETGVFTLDLSITHPNMSFIDFEYRETAAPQILYGDTNGDGIVGLADVTTLAKYIAGWDMSAVFHSENADCSGDGAIGLADVTALAKFIAGWNVTLGPKS